MPADSKSNLHSQQVISCFGHSQHSLPAVARASMQGHTAAITALHFSADSHVLVSAARDGTLCVWPAEYAGSGVPLHNIQVGADNIS
jgi:WD40 repeat protein